MSMPEAKGASFYEDHPSFTSRPAFPQVVHPKGKTGNSMLFEETTEVKCTRFSGRPLTYQTLGEIKMTYASQPKSSPDQPTGEAIAPGCLRGIHHIALNVKDIHASRYFYGTILGLHELQGDEIPETLKALVIQGKVANFRTPDGLILDLFSEPDLSPPHPDPRQQFTRANHLAFDIAPDEFDRAVAALHHHAVPIDHGPVTRPTGRGIYFYDPDGFLLEIRCDPVEQKVTEAPPIPDIPN